MLRRLVFLHRLVTFLHRLVAQSSDTKPVEYEGPWNENGPYAGQSYEVPDDIRQQDSCWPSACTEHEVGRFDTDCCAIPAEAGCMPGFRYESGAAGCGWGLELGQTSTCCIALDGAKKPVETESHSILNTCTFLGARVSLGCLIIGMSFASLGSS